MAHEVNDKLMESFMEELEKELKSVPDLRELFYKLDELMNRKTELAEMVATNMIGSKLFYKMAGIHHYIGHVERCRKLLEDLSNEL